LKGVIVEGPSDRAFVLELAKRLGLKVEVRIAGLSWRKIAAYARELLSLSCEKVIILLDTHCRSAGDWREFVINRLREQNLAEKLKSGVVKVCLAVHALEAWLMADREALLKLIGREVKVPSSPEDYCQPDKVLDAAFCKASGSRRRYYKGNLRDVRALATLMNTRAVQRACPSFAEFLASLEDP